MMSSSRDHNDVVFKFECFSLVAKPSSLAPWSSSIEVAHFNDGKESNVYFASSGSALRSTAKYVQTGNKLSGSGGKGMKSRPKPPRSVFQ